MERRIILDAQTVASILAGRRTLLRSPILNKAILRPLERGQKFSAQLLRQGFITAPGDILWVAENWQRLGDGRIVYEADDPTATRGWAPSMVMAKGDSRLSLLVKRAHAERLQQASIQSILDEGMKVGIHKDSTRLMSRWKWHWDKRWGKKGASWARNPWVQVIYFSVIGGIEKHDEADIKP